MNTLARPMMASVIRQEMKQRMEEARALAEAAANGMGLRDRAQLARAIARRRGMSAPIGFSHNEGPIHGGLHGTVWPWPLQEGGLQGLGQVSYQPSGGFNLGESIFKLGERIVDVFGAKESRSEYVSPDDPRYRAGGIAPYYPYGVPTQVVGQPSGALGAGVSISPTVALIGAAVLVGLLFGKRR